MFQRSTATTVALMIVMGPVSAQAQTGVSDDRVSLPEGPGSLEGIGENVEIDPNMGQMTYAVNVPLPPGYRGMTPTVSLRYNSGGGSGELGMGWSLPVPSLERMTARGLPTYTDSDTFTGAAGELVQVSDGEPAIYRARFEGGFVRYSWHDRGEGREGYWVAEMPDGKVQFYGADKDGRQISGARVNGPDGVFRYRLVDQVDTWGHYIRYAYRRSSSTTLLASVSYVHDADGNPQYEVEFDYEDRPDFISDAKPGFVEVIEHRMSDVRVLAQGFQIGRWGLSYEDMEAGGLSRLVGVTRYGLEGDPYEIEFGFEYSRSLGGVCDGDDCARPYLVEMGSFGVSPMSGNVTLVDLNGDALPDFLDTTDTGAHRIALSQFRSPTDHTLGAAVRSEIGSGNVHDLSAGNVQTLDVDGDGYADLLNSITGQVLENKGTGDWTRQYRLFESNGDLPDLEGDLDPDDGDLSSIRFVDVDNDKLIDVVKSEGAGNLNQTFVYRNTGSGFEALDDVDRLGLGFDSDRLQLADMNGDGLLDAVRLQPSTISYRLNLGHGKWAPWIDIDDVPFNAEGDLEFLELEDLNNDGLADLVLVLSSVVRYALSVNGTGFTDLVTIDSDGIDGDLPVRLAETTVLFADMNGSGSTDVVWVDSGGAVTYLELFAVQPNLLSRVTNGIGMVTEVTYGTTAAAAAAAELAGDPWEWRLPFPSNIVLKIDAFDTHSNVHRAVEYDYRDAYYDGVFKVPRGFAHVTTYDPGDDSIVSGRTDIEFDVGDEDPYRASLRLREMAWSDGQPLREVRFHYEDCDVDGIGTPEVDIRYLCQTRVEQTLMEGGVASEWLTTLTTRRYDGYGNITREASLGITEVGGGACEPCERPAEVFGGACGSSCLGDESFKETEYVTPDNTGGKWILQRPKRHLTYGREGSDVYRESLIYYDGEAFEGLENGQLTRGHPTRVSERVNTDGDRVDTYRIRVDSHGNSVEALRELGTADDTENHRIWQRYDDLGLRLRELEVGLRDLEGEAYRLRQELRYDPLWGKVAETTDFMVVRGGTIVSPRVAETATYDQFGRLVERYAPEDAPNQPSERVRWELGDVRSRVLIERRSEVGGPYDRVTVRCFDGLGRKYQERVRVGDDSWLVNGYSVFNHSGKVRTGYDRYMGTDGECDAAPPEGLPRQEITYDGTGRILTDTWIAGDEEYVRRNDYGPGYSLNFDFSDTDPDSPHFDTPRRNEYDGQGRNVRFTHMQAPGASQNFDFTFDELGRLRGYRDPEGNEKVHTYDLRDNLVRLTDPDRGTAVYEVDARGEITKETDSRGVVLRFEHDAMGRLRRQWDEADPEATLIEYQFDFPRTCDVGQCTNAANRMVEVTFPMAGMPRGHDWYGYDTGGNLVTHERQVDDKKFQFGWSYDHTDVLTQKRYPDGRAFDYRVDAAGRLLAVDDFVASTSFDPTARMANRTLGNGVQENFTFDGRYRIATRDLRTRDGDMVLGFSYDYDANGNILTLTDDAVSGTAPSQNGTFTYDALDRLVSAHLDPGREGLDEMMTYTYDDLGNMTSKVSSAGAASADHVGAMTYAGVQPHAVTKAGEMNLAYDAAGNMIRRGEMDIEWDCLGRLSSATTSEQTVQNWYGPGYNRVLKRSDDSEVFYLAEDFEVRDGVGSVKIQYDGITIARHESAALAATVLPDVAPAGEPDGIIDAGDAYVGREQAGKELLRAAVNRLLVGDGLSTWTHTDHTGNVVATTDDEGNVLERLAYYPHGTERGAPHDEDYDFQGKERERETGLIHYGARQLDPWLGRWISPDPAFQELDKAGFTNADEETGAYGFVANNPMKYRDSNGQFLELIELIYRGIGAGVGGAVGTYDWVKDTQREAEIMNQKASKLSLAGWGAVGFASGAVSGFAQPGGSVLANILDLGLSSALDKAVLSRVFKGQNLVTARRVTRAFTTAGVSVGIAIGLTALTGGAFPVLAIAASAVFLVGKLLYAANTHHDAKLDAGDKAYREEFEAWSEQKRKMKQTRSTRLTASSTSFEAVDGPEQSQDATGDDRAEGETSEAASKRRQYRRRNNKQAQRG